MIPPNFLNQKSTKKEEPIICPLCGWYVMYVGLNQVECSNSQCANYPVVVVELKDEPIGADSCDFDDVVDDTYF